MKIRILFFLALLLHLSLSGEEFRRMALFAGDDPSCLISGSDRMEQNYFLSPWPWDRDNTSFRPDDSLTDIVLNVSVSGYDPGQEELLFLERLSELWDGRVSAALHINEQLMEEEELSVMAEKLKTELLPLYDKGYLTELLWDLNISPEREDSGHLNDMLDDLAARGDGTAIPFLYALRREEKPFTPLWDRADNVVIKAFDFSGRHSTYENAEESVVNFIRRKGRPPSSLILAIPLYGRKYRSSDPDYWIKQLPYKELVDSYFPERDENETDHYYFNGPSMAQRKLLLSREKGLNGIALYPYEWDSRGPYSLKEALTAVIGD